MASRRVQRAKTMGSLLKSIITGVLVAVVATMMLSELGVNIGPIIASAGHRRHRARASAPRAWSATSCPASS